MTWERFVKGRSTVRVYTIHGKPPSVNETQRSAKKWVKKKLHEELVEPWWAKIKLTMHATDMNEWKGTKLAGGYFSIVYTFYFADNLHDIDNCIKHTKDGVFKYLGLNDKKVTTLGVNKIDKSMGATEYKVRIEIQSHAEPPPHMTLLQNS